MAITTTAHDLIRQAFATLQVFSPGETIDNSSLQTGLYLLKEFVDSLTLVPGSVLTVDRHVFDLDATHGGPDAPYTLGPGGIWDTGTAARPPEIENANLVLNTSAPYPVEVPLSVQTDDAYAAGQIKALTNPQPTTFYYTPSDPLGTVILWPIPTTDTNQIALYYDRLTPQFTLLETAYVCAPGYAKMFRLCLARELTRYYSVPLDRTAEIKQDAATAMDQVAASNFKMADLAIDPAFTPDPHGTYDIYTDTGG